MRRFRIRGTTVSHLVQNHTLSGHGNGAIFPMANCTSSATDKNRRIALLRTSLYPSPSPFGRFAAVVEPYRQRCVSLYSEGEALCFNHGYISRTTRTSRWRLFSDRMFGDTSLTDGTESRIQHNEIYDFSQTNIPARAQIPGRSIHRRFHGCFSGDATGSCIGTIWIRTTALTGSTALFRAEIEERGTFAAIRSDGRISVCFRIPEKSRTLSVSPQLAPTGRTPIFAGATRPDEERLPGIRKPSECADAFINRKVYAKPPMPIRKCPHKRGHSLYCSRHRIKIGVFFGQNNSKCYYDIFGANIKKDSVTSSRFPGTEPYSTYLYPFVSSADACRHPRTVHDLRPSIPDKPRPYTPASLSRLPA